MRQSHVIKRHIRNRSTNQIVGNSLFSSEIILNINILTWLRGFRYKFLYLVRLFGGGLVSKSLLGIERQKKLLTIYNLDPKTRSHVRIFRSLDNANGEFSLA